MKFKIRSKTDLYVKIFLSLILCIVVTMLILSTVFYTSFSNILQDQIYTYNLNALLQSSQDASNMTETAKTLSYQIYQDLNISKLLFYDSIDIYDIGPAITQLGYYQLSMPFIQSIYVYNDKTKTFYISANSKRYSPQSKDSIDDAKILDIINNYKDYEPLEPIPRQYTINTSEGETTYNCYSYLYYDTLENVDKLDRAVIVNISEEWLHSVIDAGSKSLNSDTFILDSEGYLLSNSGNYNMLTNLSDRNYIKSILDKNSSGYLTDTVNGVKSLITYTAPDPIGWRYIRIIPHKIIFNKIQNIRQVIILISSIILIIGFIISYIISKKLYIPIATVLLKLKNLELENRKNFTVVRQEFLRNFLLENDKFDIHSLQRKFDEHEIAISVANPTILILMKIDKYLDFKKDNHVDDRSILKFAIMNVALELSSPLFNSEAVDMGDDSIVLFLNILNSDAKINFDMLSTLSANIHAAIARSLSISLSFTIGPLDSSTDRLNVLYNQVVEASYHRLFHSHGSILHSTEIMTYKNNEYTYPTSMEKLLVDAIMTGKTDEAKKIYLEIIDETKNFPYMVINFVISHLSFTINNAINIIQKNNSLLDPMDLNNFIISLENVELIDEVNSEFFNLFEDISQKLVEKKSVKYEKLVLKINEIINIEYMNPNLCINSIADSLDMNPIYLGRLYKQYTLKTILEQITEVRMENAKSLLEKSELSVAQVSEKIGFTNSSYFYKAFKKNNGVTPAVFRKNFKQN